MTPLPSLTFGHPSRRLTIASFVGASSLLLPSVALAHDPGGLFVVVVSIALLSHAAASLFVASLLAWLARRRLPFLAIFWRVAVCAGFGGPLLVLLSLEVTNVSHDWVFILLDVVSLFACSAAGFYWAARAARRR